MHDPKRLQRLMESMFSGPRECDECGAPLRDLDAEACAYCGKEILRPAEAVHQLHASMLGAHGMHGPSPGCLFALPITLFAHLMMHATWALARPVLQLVRLGGRAWRGR